MNENDMNENEDLFEDDELMQKVSKAPEFPAATPEQVERTWQAIVEHVEEHAPATSRAGRRRGAGLHGLWNALFPAAPAWSWQMAQVAALLVIGFGAAWVIASLGLLPGARAPEEVATVTQPEGGGTPDRAWLAAGNYGSRLEALLLGVSQGDADADVAPAARQVSRELLEDNRFYQRVARRNNDEALAALLSRVETILLVLATAPEGQEQEAVEALRQYMGESDVLLELRAVQATVPKIPRQRAASTAGS